MFIDARESESPSVFDAPVCIVGAGAAGITLAVTLAQAGNDVLLVESGGFRRDEPTQQLYDGKIAGDPYPAVTLSRLRFLGGTTNHWGGACIPFAPFEFEAHPWVEASGWPITRADLDPYYERARAVAGLPEPHFDFSPAEADAAGYPPMLGDERDNVETVVWRRTQPGPKRMGADNRDVIEKSPHIRCLLHANVTQLVSDPEGRRIVRVDAATLNGRKLRLTARRIVLCTGAIENARLLLLSDARIPGGIGNEHDLVGRYFGDHGFGRLGEVHIARLPSTRWFQEESFFTMPQRSDRAIDMVGFATTPALRARHQLLGFSAIGYVYKALRENYIKSAAGVQHLTAAAHGVHSDPSLADSMRFIPLTYVVEMSPNWHSRIRLGEDKDALGLRKVVVELRTRARDHESIRESARLFGASVARAGIGRLRVEEDFESKPWCMGWGGHQTGTTRMSEDPRHGVTDRDGRVHGIENLFVSGASLYPTQGWEHPTFTIFALALRLADHLRDEIARDS